MPASTSAPPLFKLENVLFPACTAENDLVMARSRVAFLEMIRSFGEEEVLLNMKKMPDSVLFWIFCL